MQIETTISDGMNAYTCLHFMIGWGWEGVWKGQKRRKHWTFTKEDFNFPVWDWAKFRWQVTNLNLVFLHWTYLYHLWFHFPILGLSYGCGCCPEMHLVFNPRHLVPSCLLLLHVDDCIFHKEPILSRSRHLMSALRSLGQKNQSCYVLHSLFIWSNTFLNPWDLLDGSRC